MFLVLGIVFQYSINISHCIIVLHWGIELKGVSLREENFEKNIDKLYLLILYSAFVNQLLGVMHWCTI